MHTKPPIARLANGQRFSGGPVTAAVIWLQRDELLSPQSNAMKIEHSTLMNEFISFWIETSVDSNMRYETFLDFFRCEWYTVATSDDQKIVLRGKLNSALSEDDMIKEIKPIIEAAITSGTI
jgi:hypothetical protein